MNNSWAGNDLAPLTHTQLLDSDLDAPLSHINLQSQLLNAIEQAVVATSLAGTIVYWNRFAERLYGWTAGEAVGQDIVDLIAPTTIAGSANEVLERARKGESWTAQMSVRCKDGSELLAEVVHSPLCDNDQRLFGTVGASRCITEPTRIDAELRESEQKYRTLVEQASDGIHTYDSVGRFLDTNSKLCDMLGYTREELLLLNVADLVPPDDLSANPIRFEALLAGETLLKERQLLRKDGTLFYAEISGKMIGPDVIQGIVRDVTERKRFEMLMAVQKGALEMVARGEPLSETLVYLTKAVEAQGEGWVVASILLLDEEGRLHNGASPSLPDDYLKAIDGLKADVNVGTCAAAAASGNLAITRDIAADPKWAGIAHLPIALGLNAAWSMPIVAGDGHVLGTFGTYFRERREPTDLEKQVVGMLARTAALAIEQKKAESNLRDSERQLGLIADAIPLLVSFVDTHRRYRFVNRAYMEWFGRSREDVVGRHLSEVLGEAAYETIAEHVDKALSGETALYEGAVRYRTGKRFISATYIPETDASTGEVVGFHAFVQDVSARKEAEEVLRRSKAELESLVQERTRELESATAERIEILRQLVNAQEDERQRIARDLHDQLGQQMTVLRLKLSAIHKSSASGALERTQIDEVRELARALDSDIGFLAWRSRPAVLDDVGLAAALDQYVERWSTHVNITSTFDGSRFGQQRLGPESETAFYRITQEALNNVYKHAGATIVSVFLERKGSEAVLIIEDDGSGFDPDNGILAGGSGMGLTSMRERIGLIGGTLEIESSMESGTTIYAAVPLYFRIGEQK